MIKIEDYSQSIKALTTAIKPLFSMPYDFSELIDSYCGAKAEATANPSALRLNYRQKTESTKLITAILQHGKLYPLNNQLYCQAYQELLNEVLMEVSATICEQYDRTQASLTRWINEVKRFKYRVLELYPKPRRASSKLYNSLIRHSIANPVSLNQMLREEEGEGLEMIDVLRSNRLEGLDLLIEQESRQSLATPTKIEPAYESGIAPTMSDLDALITEAQQEKRPHNPAPTAFQQWINYLENDPDDFFKKKYYKDREGHPCPECNDHLILKTVLLEDFKNGVVINQAQYKSIFSKLKALAEQFNVSENTLNSSLQHSTRPHTIFNYCLGFGITFGFDVPQLKEAIENDSDSFLRNNHLRNYALCHSQWLAQQRLPYFTAAPPSFEDLVTLLAQQDEKYYRLKSQQIEDHWFKHTLPRLGQLAARLGYNS